MLSFIKVPPTTYVLHYQNGKIRREGAGLSFFYWAPTSTIVAVPLASADVPFVFQETTSDFQSVTIQGQLTYRVADPKRLASLLDFTLDKRSSSYFQDPSGDRSKLPERLVHALQTLTRAIAQRLTLKDMLVSSDSLVAEALQKLKASEAVSTLGLEILTLSIISVKPTPETSRALEAEAREALQGSGRFGCGFDRNNRQRQNLKPQRRDRFRGLQFLQGLGHNRVRTDEHILQG